MDKHFWKDAYKEYWDISSKKENFIKKLIEKDTGLIVIEIGLGAGSDAFISGSARDNNFEKGDADLYVEGADAYIEVTGPNIPMPLDAPLWFRPDKFNNTNKKIEAGKGKLHIVIHIQEVRGTKEKIIRGINLNKDFLSKKFEVINPIIRGIKETYISISADDIAVISIDEIIELIKNSI